MLSGSGSYDPIEKTGPGANNKDELVSGALRPLIPRGPRDIPPVATADLPRFSCTWVMGRLSGLTPVRTTGTICLAAPFVPMTEVCNGAMTGGCRTAGSNLPDFDASVAFAGGRVRWTSGALVDDVKGVYEGSVRTGGFVGMRVGSERDFGPPMDVPRGFGFGRADLVGLRIEVVLVKLFCGGGTLLMDSERLGGLSGMECSPSAEAGRTAVVDNTALRGGPILFVLPATA